MAALRSLLRRSWRERVWLLQAAALLWAIRLGLWLLPFQSLRGLVARYARPGARVGGLPAERVPWAVMSASWAVPFATCLTQALAAQLLLGRRGCAAQLSIGVARGEAGRIEAHAWLEHEGTIVIGGPAHHIARYTVLREVE